MENSSICNFLEIPETPCTPLESVEARLRIVEKATCIILDFDETLLLRNSTELYLASIRPRYAAVVILVIIDVLRPWRFLSLERSRHIYRDWIRVAIISCLLPWSLARWRRKAEAIARRWVNSELLTVVRNSRHGPVHVATLGFEPVVAPLLQHIAPEMDLCVAGDLWRGYRLRLSGKMRAVAEKLGPATLADAIVITDSDDDADLLSACSTPVLARWPEARYEDALANVYIPFMYTQKAKRPGSNYMLFGVLLEDVALLCIGSAWTAPSPVWCALALLILHMSFWAIYEMGYVENDLVAAKSERNPRVTKEAGRYARRMHPASAWAWALCIATPGLFLLISVNQSAIPLAGYMQGGQLFIAIFALWILYLALMRLSFSLYNRTAVAARVLPYLLLQAFRTVGYTLVVQTDIVGALLLSSLALARWTPYVSYRYTGLHWRETYQLVMLGTFTLFFTAALAAGERAFSWWQLGAAGLYLTLRARRQLRALFQQAPLEG